MKKYYSKPDIMFEDFSISTNIAGDCEVKTNTPSNKDGCGLDMSGESVFLEGHNGCKDIPVTNLGGDGAYGSLCYHVMSGEDNLFAS